VTMTQDALLGQLRLIMVGVLAYAAGKGWLSSDTLGLFSQVGPAVGLLAGPWIWSIYVNINKKLVRVESVVIDPVITGADVGKMQATVITPTGAVTGVIKVIVVGFLLSGVFIGQVHAQSRRIAPPAATGNLKNDLNTDAQNLGLIPQSLVVQPTGNVAKDLQALWTKIVAASNTDLEYASKLAASANTPASSIRKQCWDAIITVNNQANGLNLKDAGGAQIPKPDPHLFTDVETLAEVVDNLSPSGPLFTACAGAAQLAKTNVLTFVNAVVTGAAGIAAMPIIPGL